MGHGKGNRTSGKKKRAGAGSREGANWNKGPGMDEITRGEMPGADRAAEIEARRSDEPNENLPADSAAIRRQRGGAKSK